MFKGIHPLYRREVIPDNHSKMTIYCTQPGCQRAGKVVNRGVQGTGNYRSHYRKFHPKIPTTMEEELASQADQPVRPFFTNPAMEQSHNERYRVLLLEFITMNNLSFKLVDQPETKALFTFLSPNTKQISRTTLMNDLKAQYQVAEEGTRQTLQEHINTGGRISLTTDAWSGNNKMDYIAVTGHYITKDFETHSLLLDILEITEPVHSGAYLCKKLVEVTDRLGITCAIMSVTRDNAKPNDSMLDDFEAVVQEQFDLLEDREQAYFCCKFNRKDGDVRCCAHIYNIAVQAG